MQTGAEGVGFLFGLRFLWFRCTKKMCQARLSCFVLAGRCFEQLVLPWRRPGSWRSRRCWRCGKVVGAPEAQRCFTNYMESARRRDDRGGGPWPLLHFCVSLRNHCHLAAARGRAGMHLGGFLLFRLLYGCERRRLSVLVDSFSAELRRPRRGDVVQMAFSQDSAAKWLVPCGRKKHPRFGAPCRRHLMPFIFPTSGCHVLFWPWRSPALSLCRIRK